MVIKIKVDCKDLNHLNRNLKKYEREERTAVMKMDNYVTENLSQTFYNSIAENVYNKYDPSQYDRTGHLGGRHESFQESTKKIGLTTEFEAFVDGNSRDPVDGTTWDEKANKVESGNMTMREPMKRPFIDETQERMNEELEKLSDVYEKSIMSYIDSL